jgi:hypothetical protein
MKKNKKYLRNLFKKKVRLQNIEVKTMARKRYRSSRRSFFKVKRHSSRGSTFGLVGTVVGAGVYGALRERLAAAVQPVTSMMPMGNIADEIALGGLAVILKKTIGKRMPMLNPVLNGAIAIESARIGSAIASGQVSMSGQSGNSGYLLG